MMDPMNSAKWSVDLKIAIETSIQDLNKMTNHFWFLKSFKRNIFADIVVGMTSGYPTVFMGASNSLTVKSNHDYSFR